MAFQWWSASARWLEHGMSFLTPTTWPRFSSASLRRWWWWDPQSMLRWPAAERGISIVDDLVWSLVMALESVVLVSMLGFFFLFCGCNI